jgi:hypothetical protein
MLARGRIAMADEETEVQLFVDAGPLIGHPVFSGSFTDMCKLVWAMLPIPRSYARIETPEWTYGSADLESMRCEDEGEI